MQLEAERDQSQLRIDNALGLILSSQIANYRLQKKMEVNENRLVETEQEITNLKTDIVQVVPDLEQFRRGLEEGLSGDFEVKRRTYVGLIDRIVFYDHDEISIEFNLQNIDQNPDNSAPIRIWKANLK